MEYNRSGSSSSSTTEESVTNYKDKKPCQICGSNAFDDFIMTCFKCRVTREHMYVLGFILLLHLTNNMDLDLFVVLFKAVPDVWLCEECRTSRGVIFINHDEASESNQQSDS
ncbi:hypothetical protein YC2023_025917 [Brassica napus]